MSGNNIGANKTQNTLKGGSDQELTILPRTAM